MSNRLQQNDYAVKTQFMKHPSLRAPLGAKQSQTCVVIEIASSLRSSQ